MSNRSAKPTVAECIADPLLLCRVVAEEQGRVLTYGYRPDLHITQAKALEPAEGGFSVTRCKHFGEGKLWHCFMHDFDDVTSVFATTEELARTLAYALAEGWIQR